MKMPPQRRHETADAPAPPADAGVMAVSVSPRIPGGARRLAARRFLSIFSDGNKRQRRFRAAAQAPNPPHGCVERAAAGHGVCRRGATPPHREFHHPTSMQNGRFKSNKLDEEYSLCHCNC
ncbi:hypothetical protein [Burkholderia pseudomallei]|nr:hypothetical protein [Burkholderia pseudomallei]